MAALILAIFLIFNRIPKLDTVAADLAIATSPVAECFQGFCIEPAEDRQFLERWWKFSLTYLNLVWLGMVFAFLMAGITEAFLFPTDLREKFSGTGLKGILKGAVIGPALNLCSACIVPIATAFRKRGAGIETTVSITQGSSTMNLPALIMAAFVFVPIIGGSRIALSVLGTLLIGPLVAWAVGKKVNKNYQNQIDSLEDFPIHVTWKDSICNASIQCLRASIKQALRLGPIMVIAGFLSGLVIQWISPDTITTWLGDDIIGIMVAASIGIAINVPLMFEIPLVAAMLLAGMGAAPASALLFTAAGAGPITFWGLAKVITQRGAITLGIFTWVLGLIGGIVVLFIMTTLDSERAFSFKADYSERLDSTLEDSLAKLPQETHKFFNIEIRPFIDATKDSLGTDYEIWNDRPGIAVFDYDRDGDQDFYITSEQGHSNRLYRNRGDGTFDEVAARAGVDSPTTNNTGVVACDIDNDGYQDLYVGAWGLSGDNLDFRSHKGQSISRDSLFLNNRDGSFRNVTSEAFGDSINFRSATSIACADVNGDGWLDLYVGNLGDDDFRSFKTASHAGHFNKLYINSGDLTFKEEAEPAGIEGNEILMRNPDGSPILFVEPESGVKFEGYDPSVLDGAGNRIGDPTGQTHSVLFFDYDNDLDPDLWVANDGDTFHVFRNDSTKSSLKFTEISESMGLSMVGAWMGFAIGDYDGDLDLDLFVPNIGYHPTTRPPVQNPTGSCEYHHQFEWGTCFHFLLRNNQDRSEYSFTDTASSIVILPSLIMPPDSLDSNNIHRSFRIPHGLEAYDFGFGTTFFDFDNDGNQDLYWLGSTAGRGGGPGGEGYPSAGRLLRGNGKGTFKDVTVEARLLDIKGVRYHLMGQNKAPISMLMDAKFHENGKGLAHGDFNGDGYVDLVGTNSSGPLYNNYPLDPFDIRIESAPPFLWYNGGGNNNWVTLRLQGRMAIGEDGTNADGIGSRVIVL